MPRYFFTVRDGKVDLRDEEGTELPDNLEAIEEARKIAREMLSKAVSDGGAVNGRRIEVADGEGQVIYSLPLRDLLR